MKSGRTDFQMRAKGETRFYTQRVERSRVLEGPLTMGIESIYGFLNTSIMAGSKENPIVIPASIQK